MQINLTTTTTTTIRIIVPTTTITVINAPTTTGISPRRAKQKMRNIWIRMEKMEGLIRMRIMTKKVSVGMMMS